MTHVKEVDYLEDFKPHPIDVRLIYNGPAYNRICARCNSRWADGDVPEIMVDGLELEIVKCPPCTNRKRPVSWRENMHSREMQMDRIAKFKEPR